MVLPLLLAASAWAHDLQPGAVALREVAPDRFAVRLTPPLDGSGLPATLRPRWPDGCALDGPTLICAEGLAGTVHLPGMARRRVKVVVHARWLDGTTFDGVIAEGEDSLRIGTGGRWAYLRLGVEHILGGWDHLAFVGALALVARTWRSTARAVTGFTVGHSLTLALVALGWVVPPSAATELLIAASVVLLAAEAASARATLTSRRPGWVAAAFGLVHGLGFGGALVALGLPDGDVPGALLAFNVGVELGQVAVLAVAFAGAWAVARAAPTGPLRTVTAYAVGLPAGVWTVQRAIAWLGGLLG